MTELLNSPDCGPSSFRVMSALKGVYEHYVRDEAAYQLLQVFEHCFGSVLSKVWKFDGILQAIFEKPMLVQFLDYLLAACLRGDVVDLSKLAVGFLRGAKDRAGLVHIFCCRIRLDNWFFSTYDVSEELRNVFKDMKEFMRLYPSEREKLRAVQAGRSIATTDVIIAGANKCIDAQGQLFMENLHQGLFDKFFVEVWPKLSNQAPSAEVLIERIDRLTTWKKDLDMADAEDRRKDGGSQAQSMIQVVAAAADDPDVADSPNGARQSVAAPSALTDAQTTLMIRVMQLRSKKFRFIKLSEISSLTHTKYFDTHPIQNAAWGKTCWALVGS